MTAEISTPSPKPVHRKVGFLLGVGILLLPIVFAWFTLRSGYSLLARVVSFGWLILSLFLVANAPPAPSGGRQTSTIGAPAREQVPAVTEPSQPNESGQSASPASPQATSKWTYSQEKDEMRDQTTKLAYLDSDTRLDFDFPYSGGSTPSLTLRKGAKYGTDVILRVTKGQFLCNSFSDSHVSVKFDSGPITNYACSEPGDASTGVAFIRNEASFISKLAKSKRVAIEAPFFQEGNRQMTFETAGLQW